MFASHLSVGKSRVWTACRLGAGDTTTLTVTRFHADSVLLAMSDIQLKLAAVSERRSESADATWARTGSSNERR